MPTKRRSSPGPRPGSDLAAHVLDLLEPLGGVSARAMFGEHGFFKGGAMFACIWKGNVYLRTDAENRPAHEAQGLAQFAAVMRGRRMAMPYHQVPPAALESADEMERWARPALAAATRAAKARRKPAR
jgi:DNA transformation protein